MSFGKRAKNSLPSTSAQPPVVKKDTAYTSLYILLAALPPALFLIANLIPFTYNTPKYYLSFAQYRASRHAAMLSPHAQKTLKSNLGIDVSQLLTKAQYEKTAASKAVAEKCLPEATVKRLILPHLAVVYFRRSTTYLLCSMTTNITRLNAPEERKRLADQLKQYATLRQHVLALIHAMESAIGASSESQRLVRYTIDALNPSLHSADTEAGVQWYEIGNALDPRITLQIQKLNKKGYLQPEDFSWYGVFLPAEYAPFLTHRQT